jgi:hybrid cluster-associated redox disulfide protein
MIDSSRKINELLDEYPSLIKIFMKHGVNCFSCPFSKWDDLDTGLKKNGIDSQEQIDNFINEINDAISEIEIN